MKQNLESIFRVEGVGSKSERVSKLDQGWDLNWGDRGNKEVWGEGRETPAHRKPYISGSLAKLVKVPSKVSLSGHLELLCSRYWCQI